MLKHSCRKACGRKRLSLAFSVVVSSLLLRPLVESPYFARSDRSGRASIPNVPDGRYRLRIWYERSTPESLKNLERIVNISATARALEQVQVFDTGDFNLAHKNKYGQDYVPPSSPAYNHP